MTSALFVSETWLRDNTATAANVDAKMIYPFVTVAQDLYIQNVVGSKLYEALKAAIVANTLSNDQKDLLNLCRPAVAWRAVALSIPFMWSQLRNKGVMQNNSENSQPAAFSEVKWLKNESENMSEFYEKQVQNYLFKNGKLFPEYTHPDAFGIQPTASSPFESDLYLGTVNNLGSEYSEADLIFYRKYIQ